MREREREQDRARRVLARGVCARERKRERVRKSKKRTNKTNLIAFAPDREVIMVLAIPVRYVIAEDLNPICELIVEGRGRRWSRRFRVHAQELERTLLDYSVHRLRES